MMMTEDLVNDGDNDAVVGDHSISREDLD